MIRNLSIASRFLVPRQSRVLQRISAVRCYATEAPDYTGEKGKLTVNFVVPHQQILTKSVVSQVNVVTADGEVGILADHVPTVEQLVPGVLELFNEGKSEKYFVSGGFLAINPDSTLNITAVEAVPLEQIDFEAARRNLEDANRRLSAANNDKDKAIAQIEVDTYTALVAAAQSK